MDESPVTRYATAPDGVSIAYQITGDGPLDLVFVQASTFPIDLLWDEPSFGRVARRLGRFSRTVWCEARGMGASGGSFEDRFVDAIADADLSVVLDAVGCERAVLTTTSYGGPVVIRYTASHPERVAALVLIDTFAHYVREDDYPHGLSSDALDRYFDSPQASWGTGVGLDTFAPTKSGDDAFRAWWARNERLGIGVDQVAGSVRASLRQDVRALLSTLVVPTLVVHRRGNRYIRVAAGRYLAEYIPGAKYVELAGDDHMFYVGDTDGLFDEVEEFLTGSHQGPEGDLTLAAVLFTDIAASTEQSAQLRHRKWSGLTDDHDAMVRATLRRHRGREIKTIGDGFLATFDASTRAVRAAREIVAAAGQLGLGVRAGVHAGEVELRSDDVVGLAVAIANAFAISPTLAKCSYLEPYATWPPGPTSRSSTAATAG